MSTPAGHEQSDLPARLANASGPEFWRCLEEWTGSEAFQKRLENEFPDNATEWTNPLTRRRFLALMGASLLLAGIGGCTRPSRQKILPYVRQPEEITPGKPLFYATAFPHPGGALGVLVESHTGRPTKIEGNPDHPASLGATDSFAQASILSLYDPDRSGTIRYRGRPSTWVQARQALEGIRKQLAEKKGTLHILTAGVISPTLLDQLARLVKAHGEDRVRWYHHEPADQGGEREGTSLAFGEPLHAIYDLRNADVVVSLDAEFLADGPGHVRMAREFAERRRVVGKDRGKPSLARLYVAESTPTGTGLSADHRFAVPARLIPAFTAMLCGAVGDLLKSGGDKLKAVATGVKPAALEPLAKKIAAVARDLTAEGRAGRTVVIPGSQQPPVVHALAHLLNHALGNVAKDGSEKGRPVRFVEPVQPRLGDQPASLADLTAAMSKGEVKNLLMLDGNPIYDAPADLKFAENLDKVPLRIHLGLYDDETAQRSHWHIPATHYLEAWGDARAEDGTATIVQPLIAPLYESAHSAHEVLAALGDDPQKSPYDLVRAYWKANKPADDSRDFETYWSESLHDGVLRNTAFKTKEVTPAEGVAGVIRDNLEPHLRYNPAELEIVFRPDPTLYDGRYANNGWLQELPRPVTKLTWDNVALMSPKTAEKLGVKVEHGLRGANAFADVVELSLPGRESLRVPAWIVPGHADNSVTIHLGYGRTRAGKVGTGVGVSAYRLRTSRSPWYEEGLKVTRTGDRYELACTQLHHLLDIKGDADDRRIIRRVLNVKDYQERPKFAREGGHGDELGKVPLPIRGPQSERVPPSIHGDPWQYKGYKWGMGIDLSTCTGCGACVVACQAENNIPVVGKEEVLNGREMHWLRIDTYFEGSPDEPRAYFQPLPCMHCEKAPCEVVCPVEATVHSEEGLNDMVYNRCVGTRYCSNNCPYKVRRFNFLQYADYVTESLKGMRNPDVTVRTRGVMEKCTYCVQRINQARMHVEKDPRERVQNLAGESIKPIHDHELLTACQAACPSNSIVFGDLNNQKAAVTEWAGSDLNYALLEDFNTRPRTTYLAAVKNQNPDPDLR